MPPPNEIFLYRLIHRENLENILNLGKLCCPNHPGHSTAYRSIGETELIQLRSTRTLPVEPGGSFLDYISFYFGPRPVMLYAIKNGYDVPRVPQGEIIYLVSTFANIQRTGNSFVFSDGHGIVRIIQWFNNEEGFRK